MAKPSQRAISSNDPGQDGALARCRDVVPKTLTTYKLGREIAEMCGIAGVWDRQRKNEPAAVTAVAEAMTNPLRHRGPDAGAIFADHKGLFALGHPSLTSATNRDRGALNV